MVKRGYLVLKAFLCGCGATLVRQQDEAYKIRAVHPHRNAERATRSLTTTSAIRTRARRALMGQGRAPCRRTRSARCCSPRRPSSGLRDCLALSHSGRRDRCLGCSLTTSKPRCSRKWVRIARAQVAVTLQPWVSPNAAVVFACRRKRLKRPGDWCWKG